ncbi:MAG: PASTA domain-containing protein, partial [Muribaculaceae bacterium]|nr:PASTA domain-containing protein [Muribaculaceae bacterium]
GLLARHPVLASLIIIILVALACLGILYFSFAIFTRHGESAVVPGVEKMSYTQAIEILHSKGFKVDIRDSLYKEDEKPGYVIEQFPKSNSVVKPGRKIFLYINAVHPKEVIIDEDNNPREDALKSISFRQGRARLEELGFKNIRVVKVLGENDCISKIFANGKVVKKMQKVPVNAQIVMEVFDGNLESIRDSLQNDISPQFSFEQENSSDDYQNSSETYPIEESQSSETASYEYY